MSSILFMKDTPESCSECEYQQRGSIVCTALMNRRLDMTFNHKEERHPQCPLQDTTELLKALEEIGNRMPYIKLSEFTEYKKLHKALGGKNI